MRGILLGLLFSNLLYLGWNFLLVPQKSKLTDIEPLPATGPAIMLLAETAPEDLRYYPAYVAESMPVSGHQSDSPVENSAPDGEYCAEIGPFENQADAEGFIGTNSNRFTMNTEIRSVPSAPDYRVYLPPLVSRELASSTLLALREAFASNHLNIDSFLISTGELENGIALGLFAEHGNAIKVQSQLEMLGYRVIIEEQVKLQEQVWVLVYGVESKAIFDRHWAEIQLSRSYIHTGEKLCETIAHGL